MALPKILLVVASAFALRGPAPRGVALRQRSKTPRTRRQRGETSTLRSVAKTMEDAALNDDLARAAVLRGNEGCWCGVEVQFSPRTGHAMPLDPAYAPADALGWATFSKDAAAKNLWQRTTFKVVPGTAAASVLTGGIDLERASVKATGRVAAVDSCRFPSGECGAMLADAMPFVEARTIFAGPGVLGAYDRVRVDLKFDATVGALLRCVVVGESRDDCGAAPYAASPPLGPAGLDAADVAERCGAVFAAAGDGAAEFRSDGSSVLALAGGAVRLAFGPLGGGRGSFLDVALPSDGLGFRREIAGDGTLLACGADLS